MRWQKLEEFSCPKESLSIGVDVLINSGYGWCVSCDILVWHQLRLK